MFHQKHTTSPFVYAAIAILIVMFLILPEDNRYCVLYVGLVCFGAIQLVMPVELLLNSRKIKHNWIAEKATVVTVDNMGRKCCVIMEVINSDGKIIPFAAYYGRYISHPRIGDKVKIQYDADYPGDFLVFPECICTAVIYAVASLMFIAAGVIGILITF